MGQYIILFYLISLYTGIGFSILGTYLSGGWGLILSLCMVLFSKNNMNVIFLCFSVFVILLISNMLSYGGGSDFFDKLKSLTLTTASVTGGYLIYLTLNAQERPFLEKVFFYFAIFLIFGSALEVVGILRPVSDAFRNVAFSNAFIYDSEARDISDFGIVRPNLFTQEPSHLAKMFGIVGFSLYALKPTNIRFMRSMAVFLVCLVVVRSASVAPAIFVTVTLFVALRIRSGALHNIFALFAIGSVISSVLLMPKIASVFPGDRAQKIADYADNSAIERYFAPAQMAWEALKLNPLFGLGQGAKEAYMNFTISVYSGFHNYDFFRLDGLGENTFGWYSAFYEGITTIGVLGMLLLLVAVIKFFKPIFFGYLILLFSIVFLLDSGFPSPRAWGYFSVYVFMFDTAIRRFNAINSAQRQQKTSVYRRSEQDQVFRKSFVSPEN